MKLILASGSKNRQQCLTLAHIPFIAVPSDIDEKTIRHTDIRKQVVAVAKAKVEKVAQTHTGLIFGADGNNLCDETVLEKPQNKQEAIHMLKIQSGKRCSFITGYYVLNTQTGKAYQGIVESFYTFRKLTDSEIEEYVATEPVLTWAAAFSPANSMGIRFVESVSGSFSTFCYSVPLEKLLPILYKERIL